MATGMWRRSDHANGMNTHVLRLVHRCEIDRSHVCRRPPQPVPIRARFASSQARAASSRARPVPTCVSTCASTSVWTCVTGICAGIVGDTRAHTFVDIHARLRTGMCTDMCAAVCACMRMEFQTRWHVCRHLQPCNPRKLMEMCIHMCPVTNGHRNEQEHAYKHVRT